MGDSKKEKNRDKSDDYTSRILSWLYFAGLIERHDIKPKEVLVIPFHRPGRQQGKLDESESIQVSLPLKYT